MVPPPNHQPHIMHAKLQRHLAPPPTKLYITLHKRSYNQSTQQIHAIVAILLSKINIT